MSVNLSIKNVPEPLVERLRERAERHHRSMQGELLAILEETLSERKLDVDGVYQRIQELGLRTPSESTRIVRENRDAR